MSEKKINQKRGPTIGNAGNPSKVAGFKAAKAAFSATANEILVAVGLRAPGVDVPKTNHQRNQGAINGDVNKGRGPTKGNR